MTPPSQLTLAVLGDSIAYGQGADRPQDTIGSRLAAGLRAGGTAVDLQVFAVPRARSDALAAQVDRALAVRLHVALIIVGANDLTHFVPTGTAATQLGDAVATLRAAGAEVVVAPAPDLSVVPWVPLQMRAMVKGASDLLRQAQATAALAAGARVADLNGATAATFAGDPAMFSGDRFHPSSAGYRVIAAALTPEVTAAARAWAARRR